MSTIACCPYCGSESFKGDVTTTRVDVPGQEVWINQCSVCEQFSAHQNTTGTQIGLVTPSDNQSDLVSQHGINCNHRPDRNH